jgi:integrase
VSNYAQRRGKPSSSVKARYLVTRQQKGGSLHYWQPTDKLIAAGFRARRLSNDPAEAFAQAEEENRRLDAWRKGTPLSSGPKYRSDSLCALDDLFQRSDEFRRLGERSQRDYCYNIKSGLAWAGDMRSSDLSKGIILDWHQQQRDARGPAAARNAAVALRRLLSFGVNRDWLPINPALALRLPTPRGVDRVWTITERDRFVARAQTDGWASMALAAMLGWCLGQRPADLRTLAWSAYDGRTIKLRQRKTGRSMAIPVLPELKRLLDTETRTATEIVISERTGRPYSESDFQHRFAKIRAAAGLPVDLQFRLLRHTLATALGAAGCTGDQIRAVTGHLTRGVVARYVQPDQTFADGAMKRLKDASRKAELKGLPRRGCAGVGPQT